MRLLIDTQILLRIAADTAQASLTEYILDESNELIFSAASIWEMLIKSGLSRAGYRADPEQMQKGLLENGYRELAITSEHILLSGTMPMHHKDPFDRIILAQSLAEDATVLTNDIIMTKYPAKVIFIK